MTRAEAERLLEAIETTADDLISGIGDVVTAPAQAKVVGMQLLKEHLLKTLDFRGFASDESNVDGAQTRELVDRYCRGHCAPARFVGPGQAAECLRCPLRHVFIDPMLKQTSRAGGA